MNTTRRIGEQRLNPPDYTSPHLQTLLRQTLAGSKRRNTERAVPRERFERGPPNADDLYVVKKIVRCVGSGPRLKYVVQLYG